MRVLLGFETPELGSVQFDGHDLAALDARGLRRQMGVVMQTSGLLTGDILMNIVGARDLTVEDAWDAARTTLGATLNDESKSVDERGGAAIGLYAVADRPDVRKGLEALYAQGGPARIKALEAIDLSVRGA